MAPFIKPPTISDDYRSADLYRQAADIFHEKGFASTTMDDLAESVDLSQGGLYYYIKGKAALLFAIMGYALDRLETEVLQEARRQEDPEECLSWLLQGYLSLVLEEPGAMSLLHSEEESLDEEHRRRVASRKGLFMGFFRDLIESIFYAVGAAEMEPEEAAETLLSRLHSRAAELANTTDTKNPGTDGEDPVDIATIDLEEATADLVRWVLAGGLGDAGAVAG